jgi:hypothetical protein
VEARATLPPSSPSHTTPSPHWEVVSLQTGSVADDRCPKHPLTEGGSPNDSSRQLLPTQVTSDHEGQGGGGSLRKHK